MIFLQQRRLISLCQSITEIFAKLVILFAIIIAKIL